MTIMNSWFHGITSLFKHHRCSPKKAFRMLDQKKADFCCCRFSPLQGMEDLSTWHRPHPGAEMWFGWLLKTGGWL